MCAALAVAACGGGSTSGPLSKSQLAARVNAACASYAKSSGAIPQPADLSSNPAAAAAYLDKLRPLVESEHAAIAGLKATPDIRAAFARFQSASSHQLALFQGALAKARAGNPADVRDLLLAARYKQTVLLPLERELGFSACER